MCQCRTSTKCQYRQPVRDQLWQTSAEHRYHPRHMPALRPHLPVRAQYRARCKFLIGNIPKIISIVFNSILNKNNENTHYKSS